MRGSILLVLLLATSRLFCNMAYWGPEPGNVAGRNTTGKIRVKHEEIMVDMRGLPNGRIRVFADYRLESKEAGGEMIFLFVASGQNPVNPEIILDGQVMPLAKVMLPYFHNSRGDVHWIPRDSWPEAIGMELESDLYFRQPIEDSLWTFRLPISPGIHRLKIGYEVTATAFDKDHSRYFTFPYYLGNKFTRPLYDSIAVKVMLPNNVSYTSNATFYQENEYLVCKNLVKFKPGHFYISVYKNAEPEIFRGRIIHGIANGVCWILMLILALTSFRLAMDKRGKIGSVHLLIVPVAIGIAWFNYFSLTTFYAYFRNEYGPYISGYFGRTYYFMNVPIIAFLVVVFWFILAVWYSKKLHSTKWDPTRLWMKKPR